MSRHPRAGQPAKPKDLINIPELMAKYYVLEPNISQEKQQVSFGTSGHRGSAFSHSFNEAHVLAVCQAICAYREEVGITGPLLLGKDTHALSTAAFMTAIEVFIANGITLHVQADLGFTPTPVISHEILKYNQNRTEGLADGVILTPSHNPPQDGGIKYNPPHGGPADTDATAVIEKYANAILASELVGVEVIPYEEALQHKRLIRCAWMQSYVEDLKDVVDLKAIAKAQFKIAVHAMGGAGMAYWHEINRQYGLSLNIYHDVYDPSFAFMTLDKDGAIRMDCSSPDAMRALIDLKHTFDLAVGNDPDYDRHGIVTPEGLMNPNHFLVVCIDYLSKHRTWNKSLKVGKTLVSSALIDRVVKRAGFNLMEVPVGFKWFAQEMHAGELVFAGEESAGASFLDFSGQPFSTDKDGFILALLAMEILAVTGKTPQTYYLALEQTFGQSFYQRKDYQASVEQVQAIQAITKKPPVLKTLAGEPVLMILTEAPGNKAPIGGVKVITENGWFAVRPSGTEPVYKLYAESLLSEAHLSLIFTEAETLIQHAFGSVSV